MKLMYYKNTRKKKKKKKTYYRNILILLQKQYYLCNYVYIYKLTNLHPPNFKQHQHTKRNFVGKDFNLINSPRSLPVYRNSTRGEETLRNRFVYLKCNPESLPTAKTWNFFQLMRRGQEILFAVSPFSTKNHTAKVFPALISRSKTKFQLKLETSLKTVIFSLSYVEMT